MTAPNAPGETRNSLSVAMLSAAQNALRKHIAATGRAPRTVSARVSVRTETGTATYLLAVTRIGHGA